MSEYRTSAECGELFTALAAVQATIENVGRDAENAAFKRGTSGKLATYATLGAVLDLARPALGAAGLSLCQMPVNGDGNNIGVVTVLGHKSGQWIESTVFVAPREFTAQGAGSVITYLRRYAAMAMIGLAPEDDDGNEASIASPAPRREPTVAAKTQPTLRETPAEAKATQEARDAWKRIHDALEKAKQPKIVDDVVKLNEADLQKIKTANAEAYEGLMQLAAARKTEMLAAA